VTEREQRIRKLVGELSQSDSGISPEYNLLSLSDTQFLLEELAFLRDELEESRGEFARAFANGAAAAFGGIPPSTSIPVLK
jgi:hypothetical protein